MRNAWIYFLLFSVSLVTVFHVSIRVLAEENKTTIQENELYARSAVLMDAESGRVLYGKEENVARPNASTTKIITCILALENGELDALVEVSDYAASMPDVQLHIMEGEYYYLKDLLYSLMLESHNDSAVAIAEHIAGTTEHFADMMNDKAREIGCKNTHFITPNGLDAEEILANADGSTTKLVHSTTAEDLALIMSYCITKSPQKDIFLQITREEAYSFANQVQEEDGNIHTGKRSFFCYNHNQFLSMMEGALSGKTGFTGDAGYCYVGALERDERTYVVAVLACGWPYNKNYKWSDTRKLMEYGITQFHKVDLAALDVKTDWMDDISVVNGKTEDMFQTAGVGVYIRDENGSPSILLSDGEDVEVICSMEPRLYAPVQKNQVVGHILYSLDGKIYWDRQICIRQGIEKRDFPWYLQMIIQKFIKKPLAL